MKIELTILKNLVHNEDFARKTLPFLREEYFGDSSERVVYKRIADFMTKYNSRPTREAIGIEIESSNNLSEEEHKRSMDLVRNLVEPEPVTMDWLLESTEAFCQERAVFNAVMDSISILDGKDKNRTKNSIPEILSEALGVSFDSHIGHDFIEDFGERYDFYHRVEEKIAFDLEYFNKITRGGLSRKSLNIILAGTGVGKTLAMCHFAAANLAMGKNVLYITMEMAEEKIAERIDANLLNVASEDLQQLPRDLYENKIARLKTKTTGKLIIKEYPTASAHAGHFRHLLNELNLKRNFVPDIIYIDYLNICCSSRIKPGSNINSYTYIKSIAEELRGLAVEKNLPIVSATQTTRSGYTSSDPGLEDTSESFGLPATADFMIALVRNEEMDERGQLMVKQLKNRYSDPANHKRFVVGIDRVKMRLFDAEEAAQDDLIDDSRGGKTKRSDSVMDNTKFGMEDRERSKPKPKFNNFKFG
jgi:archaellum biogenesis ATPase FlaH